MNIAAFLILLPILGFLVYKSIKGNPSWKFAYFRVCETLNKNVPNAEEEAKEFLKIYGFDDVKCQNIIEACRNGDIEWLKNNFKQGLN